MESFLHLRKTERTARKVCRSHDEARAEVFDDMERVYTPCRRYSKLGRRGPMEFVAPAMPALPAVHETGGNSFFMVPKWCLSR